MVGEKILIAEDEEHMRKVLSAYLKKEGYSPKGVANGKKALEIIEEFDPDLLILDLMLPGLSGEELCQRLRKYSNLPVLMLTAKGRPADRIEGFKVGADDYLVKPFHPEELIMRIKAILKRTNQASNSQRVVLKDGKLVVDFKAMSVLLNGQEVKLTTTEFQILKTLIQNKGQVLTREQIMDKALGWDFTGFDRTIDAHIKNIRNKLRLDKGEYIITVYGTGYRFIGENNE